MEKRGNFEVEQWHENIFVIRNSGWKTFWFDKEKNNNNKDSLSKLQGCEICKTNTVQLDLTMCQGRGEM